MELVPLEPYLPTLHVDIGREMSHVVRGLGGIVVADTLGESPAFKNADYAFPRDNVVAELKCLERNTRDDRAFRRRLSELYARWVRQGLVPRLPGAGVFEISTRGIPPECAKEVLALCRNRIQKVVKSANAQIRETKAALGLPRALGLLMLANDGDYLFELDGVFHALHHIFTGKYSSINTVLYFTPNMRVRGGGAPDKMAIWSELVLPAGPGRNRDSCPDDFLDRLSKAWFTRMAELTGNESIAVDMSGITPEVVETLRLTKPESKEPIQQRIIFPWSPLSENLQ